jgi:hypothetical protein
LSTAAPAELDATFSYPWAFYSNAAQANKRHSRPQESAAPLQLLSLERHGLARWEAADSEAAPQKQRRSLPLVELTIAINARLLFHFTIQILLVALAATDSRSEQYANPATNKKAYCESQISPYYN